ncbi:putative reverse transcriptase, RNA-dependent DNA polymerase [Tanacetum coccineum]
MLEVRVEVRGRMIDGGTIVGGGIVREARDMSGKVRRKSILKLRSRVAGRRHRSVNNPVERVKSILILAIPDEYLLKFHNVEDAKSLWEAIKSRFEGNEESKKMQKNVLKHQFENFSTALNESLDKAYDRFQKLISQLEVHGAPISKEDINQKFLRSLPPLWNQIALIMINKPDIDEIDIDDLYNNLRSTNEVSTASGDFGVSTAGGTSQVPSTPCAHDVAYSFFAQPTTSPQLENEDFQQIDEDDLEELDLRWQVAMLTVRCYNCHRKEHFAKECRSGRNQGKRSYGDNGRSNAPKNESSSQAMGAQDGLGGYDWSNDFEIEPVNYALMAISSSSSSSSYDNKIEKWEESSKNLDELLNSEMSARDKANLGYGAQLNEMSNNSETDSEISLSVFDVRSSDEENTPANYRFSKADGFHVVAPPITGNFLTPRVDISFAGLDEYAIRKKIIESKTTDLNTKTSETVVQTVSPVKTNETQTVKTRVDKISQTSQKQGIGFKKLKACFVCKSTDHLIKDCNFHDKQSQEPKLETVVNTGPRVDKPFTIHLIDFKNWLVQANDFGIDSLIIVSVDSYQKLYGYQCSIVIAMKGIASPKLTPCEYSMTGIYWIPLERKFKRSPVFKNELLVKGVTPTEIIWKKGKWIMDQGHSGRNLLLQEGYEKNSSAVSMDEELARKLEEEKESGLMQNKKQELCKKKKKKD